MRISPLDIKKQKFSKSAFGFDKAEVQSFLELVSSQVAKLEKEVAILQEQNENLGSNVGEHQSREQAIKETMLAAQKVGDELKENAQKQAELIIAKAEVVAKKMLNGTRKRHLNLLTEIGELKRQKIRMMRDLKANLLGFLETLNIQDEETLSANNFHAEMQSHDNEITKTAMKKVEKIAKNNEEEIVEKKLTMSPSC